MTKDKYTATWVSHTSINAFLQCPRSYYLKNVYKDPKTNHKIQIMSPPLALGQIVHEVLESLSVLPTHQRFNKSLIEKFNKLWSKVSGKKGGFYDKDIEHKYKKRGENMIRKVMEDPGPIANLAVKIKEDLPYYWLSEEENIILCGKIDWLEYLPDTDSVHIIDFKTSKSKEEEDSLQLPIYHLLVHHCQQRKVSQASYWYLGLEDGLVNKDLPDLQQAHEKVYAIAKRIKTARALENFKCPQGDKGCFYCKPMERILKKEGELVGVNDYGQDVYILPKPDKDSEEQSYIL